MNSDGKVKIDIELDSKKFNREIDDIKKLSEKSGKEINKDFEHFSNKANKLFDSISKSASQTANKIGRAFGKTKFGKAIQTSSEVAKKALGSLGEKAKQVSSKFGFLGKGLKTSLLGVGKLMTAGVTASATAVSGLLAMGAKYNSDMENYMANFRVMLGSQEEATKKVNDLKELAAKTPFGMADLADATQTLLAFQVPAEETQDILKMMGDIALGDKQKLSGLALVFGQVSSAGKLTGQDLMQFINQGFNPLNYIAQRTGESMSELRDRMSKGAVSVEEVKQAFVDATSKGGQFYKGMETASKTLSGQLSTLKDDVSSLMGEISQSFSTGMEEKVVPKALESVHELTEAFEEEGIDGLVSAGSNMLVSLLNTLVEKAPELLETGATMVHSIIDGFLENKDALVENTINLALAIVDSFIELLPEFIDVGIQILEALLIGLIEHLPDIIARIPDLISALWDAFKSAVASFARIGRTIVEKIWEGIKNGWGWLKDKVQGWVDSLVDGFFGGGNSAGKASSSGGRYGRTYALNSYNGTSDSLMRSVDLNNALNGGVISNNSSYAKNVTQNFYSSGLTSPFEAYRKAMIYGY